MIKFKADDGYSYLIEIQRNPPLFNKTFRIDSEEIEIQLGTDETMQIKRLDIQPGISIKLRNIREQNQDTQR